MNDHELECFEAELRRLKPAEPPEEFMARLAAARPMDSAQADALSRPARTPEGWRVLLRWLAPATAVAVAAVLLARYSPGPENRSSSGPVIAAAAPALKADQVEIDRQLVGAFDTVAHLPGGEPVRLSCREWVDNMVLRDTKRGIEVEQRTPRLEVIPVGLATY